VHVLARCFVTLAVVAIGPQTSNEYHARFGNPDVERFVVRPDLNLTAEYGSDGLACRIRIERLPDQINGKFNQPPAPTEEVTTVLDEVVPPEVRGKLVGSGEQISGRCHGAAPPTEYEKAEIRLYYGLCDKVPTVHGVEVYFKRPVCENDSK
jgi:hypothetical protein